MIYIASSAISRDDSLEIKGKNSGECRDLLSSSESYYVPKPCKWPKMLCSK
jgi:hypothetical protein